jgi:hypothetical protein
MSQFIDKTDLFMEPKTTQYGSHMVMTNVHKPTKRKFVNIDTRFSDEYNYLTVANCGITLPERINDVKSISVLSVELPLSFYNISSSIGNNSFQITTATNKETIIIPDGEYTSATLKTAVNSLTNGVFVGSDIDLSFNILASQTGGDVTTVSSAVDCSLNFAVNDKSVADKYNIKSKLGWLLGFRKAEYNIKTTISAEAKIDLNGPRYLYLAMEDFHNGNKNSFLSTVSAGLVNKNVLARISIDKTYYKYGSVMPANLDGLLLTDVRKYSGKVDLQRMNFQLLNEIGNPISLNGYDYSFCLEIEHE